MNTREHNVGNFLLIVGAILYGGSFFRSMIPTELWYDTVDLFFIGDILWVVLTSFDPALAAACIIAGLALNKWASWKPTAPAQFHTPQQGFTPANSGHTPQPGYPAGQTQPAPEQTHPYAQAPQQGYPTTGQAHPYTQGYQAGQGQ